MYYMNYFYSVKVIFVAQNVSRMNCEGEMLGGAQKFHHNPYLNGTTVPLITS